MNRRSFLKLCAAVAVVVAMPFRWVRHKLYGDGITDDTAAVQALIDGEEVEMPDGSIQQSGFHFPSGTYRITAAIEDKNGK